MPALREGRKIVSINSSSEVIWEIPAKETRHVNERAKHRTNSALVLFGLPGSAKWALGLLVGVNLIFGGVALAAMALHAHTSAPDR